MGNQLKSTILLSLIITIAVACQKKKSGIFTDAPPAVKEAVSPSPEIILTGSQYVVTDLRFGINTKDIKSVVWHFGDDSTSTEIAPQHTYYEPREYTIKAIVQTEDSTFTLSKTANINLGTERLNKIRDWHIKLIFLDSSVKHNGPSAPNPTKVIEVDTSFRLRVASDYNVWIPNDDFYPEKWNLYTQHIHTDTQANYIWYRRDINQLGYADIVYYYKNDSITIFRNQSYFNNKSKQWERYYGLYHTK